MQYIVIQHITFAPNGALLTMRAGRNTDVSIFVAKKVETVNSYGAIKINGFITDENIAVKIETLTSRRVSTIAIAYDNIEEAIATMLQWQKAAGSLENDTIKTQAIGSWIGAKGAVISKINKYSKRNIRVEKID